MSDRFRIEGRRQRFDEDETGAGWMEAEIEGYDDHDDEPSREPMKRQAWEQPDEDSSRKRSPRHRRAEA